MHDFFHRSLNIWEIDKAETDSKKENLTDARIIIWVNKILSAKHWLHNFLKSLCKYSFSETQEKQAKTILTDESQVGF